ncbi:PLP-dependent aminotransferase family protein [Paenibacillus paeoniae]|uniref:PLP-dependent aminotransferase family protein n=1 Tax=Paenibacillus paeoniae TaxID=2292705 RepID=A0A371PJ20_9BACL|nr:PLP-dependent aminotransferase family protein [Paenibacillus paeoniae]REK76208.1 PLP-dependent aminotransferase family protein [Paenibacillus paeoniae]
MLSITPLLYRNKSTPLYIQLYSYIRSGIEEGSLPSGEAMPSIRQLAHHLGISKNTVESAYGQLVAEGYLENRERAGYLILPLEQLHLSVTKAAASDVKSPSLDGPSAPIRYDFYYGAIAFDHFPHAVWKSCVTEAMAADHTQVLGYGNRMGHEGLREEIAKYVYQSRGVICEANQIIISAGIQHLMSVLVQLLRLSTETIAMEEPGYNGVKSVLRNLGCTLVPVEVESDGIHVNQLYNVPDAKLVYVTPSHQFPLGMVMPIGKRYRLLQWAAEHGSYIIEDDYDSEFRYSSAPIPALKALDSNDRVIYMGTFSKSFLPSARLSYAILPHSLLKSCREKLEHISPSVSPLIQEAVWLFMKKGHFARHLRRMRRVYQARHKALSESIREVFGDKCGIIGDGSGMHLLLDVKGRHASELIPLAEKFGCKVYPPDKHWNNPADCPPSYIMLGFGGLDEYQLQGGIQQLGQAWIIR